MLENITRLVALKHLTNIRTAFFRKNFREFQENFFFSKPEIIHVHAVTTQEKWGKIF